MHRDIVWPCCRVDVLVSPVKSVLVGTADFGYPAVLGDINLMKLVKLLNPTVLVPLMNSEIDQEGPLAGIVVERGSYKETKRLLADLPTRLEFPAPPGEAVAVAL